MNFQITQGSGTTIATDTGGGGENYQKVKLIDATVGSTAGTGIASNPLRIDPTGTTIQPVSGTVTSNIGTTGGLALDTTVASLVVGQGSTTSGQLGVLNMGAVSTTSPSYATGQSSPLSLTLTGALRVDGSSATQPISGSVAVTNFPALQAVNITEFGGASIVLGQENMAGSIPVTFASDQTALPPSKDIAVTGTLGSLVDTVVINCNALSTVGWTTSGTWSGTMVMEVQYGDGQWFLVEVIDTNLAGDGKPVVLTSWTEGLNNDPWITNVGGATQARIRFTTYNSGTATIVFNGSVGINALRTYNLNASAFLTKSWLNDGSGNAITSTSGSLNTNVTNASIPVTQSGSWTVSLTTESIEIGKVDQGTPNTLANAWPVQPTDGTNSQAFTASGEGKVSITQPLPSGTNVIGHVITDSGSTTAVTGTVAATQSGTWSTRIQDGSGNNITSQTSGAQRALDVGIDVAGVQIDPRQIRTLTSSDVVTADQGGIWNITNISGTITLPTGASTSANQTNGAQKTQIVDGSGNVIASTSNSLNVDVTNTITVSGTVTSNIGTTGGLALDTSVTGLQVSQGSTTSGQKGTLIQGAVTTAAPTYTTAQTSPLSLTTSGALRTDSSATTQPVSGTVTSNQGTAAALSGAWPVEVTDGTNVLGTSSHPVRIDPTGTTTQPVSGTVTANQGGAPWSQNVTQIAGSSIATAATGIAKVGITDGSGNSINSTSNALNVFNAGGNVSLGISTGKTVQMLTGTLVTTATTADQVVLTYTVTTGKTLYLEYVDFQGSLTSPTNTGAVIGTISLENPSGTKVFETRFTNSSVATFGNNALRFAEPIPVPSTTVIRVVTTPGVTTSITWLANFGGYEA